MNQMTNVNPDSQSPMLRVNNLTHRVSVETDTLTILQGVTLEINRGESVAIVGRSGSGKTTLLGLLAGLDTPTEGTVELDGSVISKLSEDERAKLRAHRVGFVFQSFQLLPALTALENVMLPLELAGMSAPEKRARELLERVGLGERLTHTPRQLSGGEQQRVAIARALAMDPVAMLFDEPTSALDPEMIQEVLDVMVELTREGMTMMCVTHEMGFASQVANRIIFMDEGYIVENCSKDEFFEGAKSDRAQQFLSKILNH